MEPGRIPIPNNLGKYRCLAGYSQSQVAKILGLQNYCTLSRWEQGKAFPSIAQLFQLSQLYKTHPIHLYQDFWQRLKIEVEEKANSLFGNREQINNKQLSYL